MKNPQNAKFGALYNDQADVRVYGVGTTASAAERDARQAIRDLGWDADEEPQLQTVALTRAQARAVAAGSCAADELGLLIERSTAGGRRYYELPDGRTCRLIVL